MYSWSALTRVIRVLRLKNTKERKSLKNSSNIIEKTAILTDFHLNATYILFFKQLADSHLRPLIADYPDQGCA